ncbi:MAG: DNA-processing protein DprA [Campylobacterales bacterium]
MNSIEEHIPELDSMKKYPEELFYIGDTSLLQRKKVSIIGSRKPNQYARYLTQQISLKLSQSGVCIVSGGALGVDAIAHKSAGANNTIMVAGTGLDKRYPAVNKSIIQDIESNGLVLSQFRAGTPSQRYNFPIRNELVVALGDVLIVTYADINSGTMRSIEYAQKMQKDIYVLPHRIGESDGTNTLLKDAKAKAIYDVDDFIQSLVGIRYDDKTSKKDDFLEFCSTNPTYEETLKKFPSKVFEAELLGDIEVINGRVSLK